MTHQELLRLSLVQAQALIAGKEVTPLELVDAYLSRIEETEAEFRSFAEVYADAARSSAPRIDRDGGCRAFSRPPPWDPGLSEG